VKSSNQSGDPMKIKSIELVNYRIYKGKHSISFNGNGAQPGKFIVLAARNTVGKSCLFNAITWCLFGTEDHIMRKSASAKQEPIINTDVLSEAHGSDCNASVKIELSSGDKHYILEKKVSGRQTRDGLANIYEPTIELSYASIGKTSVDKSWHRLIGYDAELHISQHILDRDVRQFFLIDGERLRDFFIEQSGKAIRDSVLKVTEAEHIKSLSSAVKALHRKVSVELSKTQPNLKSAQDSVQAITDAITATHERRGKTLEEIGHATKEKRTLEERINSSKNQEYIALTSRLKAIDSLISGLNKEIADIEAEIDENILDNAFAFLLKGNYNSCIEIINKNEERGLVPSYLSDPLKEYIEEKGLCICGTKIQKNSPEWKSLEGYFNKSKYSKLRATPLEGRAFLKSYKDKASQYEKSRNELVSRLEGKDGARLKLIGERGTIIEKIDKMVKGLSKEEIESLELRRRELEGLIEGANQEIGRCDAQLISYNKNLDAATKLLEEEMKKDTINVEMKKTEKIYREADALLLRLQANVELKVREEMQKMIKERFFSTGTREVIGDIGEITLDEGFEIDVKKKNGYSCLHNMSAGQSLVFTLAVATTLRDMSRYEFPLVIDTPISKLDKENEKAVMSIPSMFPDVQLALLMILEKEYTQSLRNDIKNRIHREYLLVKAKGGTKVLDSSKMSWSEIINMAYSEGA